MIKTDQELAALAKGTPDSLPIKLDEVLKNVTIEPEYAFLVTSDNALLMGCLASLAEHEDAIACPPGQVVWDIIGAILDRQVQTLSFTDEKDG